jgi:hypothetical protein
MSAEVLQTVASFRAVVALRDVILARQLGPVPFIVRRASIEG